MFADLLNRLTGGAPAPDRSMDYRLALAALLVRCARADEDYAQSEKAMIARVLATGYGLDADAAAALRDRAETVEAEVGDTVVLTKAIKDGVPYDERGKIVEALWRIALADDSRDQAENAFLRLVVKLIGVSDVDSGLARQRAQSRLG